MFIFVSHHIMLVLFTVWLGSITYTKENDGGCISTFYLFLFFELIYFVLGWLIGGWG